MELVDFGRLTVQRRAELEGGEADPFDMAGVTLHYRPKERHLALQDDGRLVASTGMVRAEVEVAGLRFPVIGFGGVIVNAAYRGRGLARRILEAAVANAQGVGPDFAMLFCHEDRRGLYARLGFSDIADEVRVRQPDGFAVMPQHTMRRALHAGAEWPRGPVTVHGLPF